MSLFFFPTHIFSISAKPSNSFVTNMLNFAWGRILGRNWDKSLQSFPPCCSQSPLITGFTSSPPLNESGLKLIWNVNIVYGTSQRTLKIMHRNLNEIVRSWIRLLAAAEKASLAKTMLTNERYIEFGAGRKCIQIFTYEWTMRFACRSIRSSSVLFWSWILILIDPFVFKSVFRTWIRIRMFRLHNNFGKISEETLYNIRCM